MSDTTYDALEDAIRAHIADIADDGHTLLTDWYLMTAAVATEIGSTGYLHVCSDMPMHTAVGLVGIAFKRLNTESSVDD